MILTIFDVEHAPPRNPNKVAHLGTICLRVGILPPQIVTAELLWEKDDETS
jgi:hypothetical protein